MSTGPSFEEYLQSKRIASEDFMRVEPDVWHSWKREFEQMHPNSFTVQKLNLINAIRRKYTLPSLPVDKAAPVVAAAQPARPGKPIIRPKSE